MSIEKLENQILEIENLKVTIESDVSDSDLFIKDYPIKNGSPGNMMLDEWVEQFNKLYPELEVYIDASNLSLTDLRRRFREYF